MADQSAMEKTERATPKRRREARQKGRVAKSAELNTSLMLAVATLLVLTSFPHIVHGLKSAFETYFSYASSHMDMSTQLRAFAVSSVSQFFIIISPVFLATVLMALVVNFGQVGFYVSANALLPKFERVNPLEGAKRIFGKRAPVELAKGLFKIAIICGVGYLTYHSRIEELTRLAFAPATAILPKTIAISAAFLIRVVIALLVLAVMDYLYQRWDFEKSIRMSKQELKEEMKDTEGDPLLKSRVRAQQQKLSSQRMMDDVPRADVIITNPTHYAIALGYEQGDDAPTILAKGVDAIAERIKEIGREHDVPILEKPELARLLYKEGEIGKTIPTVFFEAVAEVLAYVYKLRGKGRR